MADATTTMVNALRGLSPEDQAAMQPETYANPFAKALLSSTAKTIAKPAELSQPNPYPEGSEEASWFEDQRQKGINEWGPRTAVSMLGAGAPAAEAGAAGIFGGKLAKTANLDKLEQAQRMIGKGQDRNIVRQLTGWHQQPDEQWRFEIPDERSRMLYPNNQGPAGALFQHNELYQAYPGLKNVNMASEINPNFPNDIGEFSLGNKLIDLSSRNPEGARLGALHEMQHAVQHIENFNTGGNVPAFEGILKETPDLYKAAFGERAPYDAYYDLAGEVEARNVENRANFGPQQRYEQPPWKTQDRSFYRQLVFPQATEDEENQFAQILRSLRGQ